jgi:hypothetical protein
MRGWHELVAAAGDLVPGGVPVLGLGLLLVTTIAATLWYFWPDWLPAGRRDRAQAGDPEPAAGGRRGWLRWWRWRGFRLGWSAWRLRFRRWRLRWRWRRRRPAAPDHLDLVPDTGLPEVPAAVLALTADELAAQGRYREAVRERLRAIVRDLVDRGVVANHPGWTVTELAGAAGQVQPAIAVPLAGACEVFSRIWYGQRPARAAHDAAMRQYAGQVRAALDQPPVAV